MVLLQFHTNKINRNLIPTTPPHVVVNDTTVDMALRGCGLRGKVPNSTVYSCIKVARKNGMYNKEIRSKCEKKEQKLGLIIEIPDDGTTTLRDNISPVTITTINSSLAAGGSNTTITTKKSRQSSRQASIARLDAKRVKLDYGSRYKTAFKDATNLVAVNAQNEPVHTICNRLNRDFKLDRAKRLARSTVYQAAKMVALE